MYSPFYIHIRIYKDIELTESVATNELVGFLQKLQQLQQDKLLIFNNTADFPFTSICLLQAKNLDGWCHDPLIERVNLIEIVCIKDNQTEFWQIEELVIKIADFLQWIMEVERDDAE